MSERPIPQKVYRVVYKCDTLGCGGEMQATGFVLTSSPPKYPHICPECGVEKTFRDKYPALRYENVPA